MFQKVSSRIVSDPLHHRSSKLGERSAAYTPLLVFLVQHQRKINTPKEENTIQVQDSEQRWDKSNIDGRCRYPQFPVGHKGFLVITLELRLNRLQSLSLQRSQKGKDEHSKDGRLDELVNYDLDTVGGRERFYRGWNLTV